MKGKTRTQYLKTIENIKKLELKGNNMVDF